MPLNQLQKRQIQDLVNLALGDIYENLNSNQAVSWIEQTLSGNREYDIFAERLSTSDVPVAQWRNLLYLRELYVGMPIEVEFPINNGQQTIRILPRLNKNLPHNLGNLGRETTAVEISDFAKACYHTYANHVELEKSLEETEEKFNQIEQQKELLQKQKELLEKQNEHMQRECRDILEARQTHIELNNVTNNLVNTIKEKSANIIKAAFLSSLLRRNTKEVRDKQPGLNEILSTLEQQEEKLLESQEAIANERRKVAGLHKEQEETLAKQNQEGQAIQQKIIEAANNRQFNLIADLADKASHNHLLIEASEKRIKQLNERDLPLVEKEQELNASLEKLRAERMRVHQLQDVDTNRIVQKSDRIVYVSKQVSELEMQEEKLINESKVLESKLDELRKRENERVKSPASQHELSVIRSKMQPKQKFASLFRSEDKVVLSAIKNAKIDFFFNDQNWGYHYLDVDPDLARLFNDAHFDSFGRNIINKVEAALNRNPNFIKSLQLRGSDNKPIDLTILRNGTIRVEIPPYGKNAVVNYMSDWIQYSLGQLANKPGPFTKDYGMKESLTSPSALQPSPAAVNAHASRQERRGRGEEKL